MNVWNFGHIKLGWRKHVFITLVLGKPDCVNIPPEDGNNN